MVNDWIPVVVALIVGASPTLAIIVTQREARRIAHRNEQQRQKDLLLSNSKTEEIHTLVNDRLTQALQKIEALTAELAVHRAGENKG
jgi:hypothetical protein